MPWDADAALAALEPPTIVIGGRSYVGRHVSRQQMLPFLAALDRKDGSADRELLILLRRVWPRHWWQVWRPNIPKYLANLPPPIQEQWAQYFFASLVRLLGQDAPDLPDPLTPGTT